ncbi:MAG: TIGR02646 family protein [Candidatus Symbiobacter sp.]|nr:TIGR02646 family protein [Candidatus Symbiobacter sp.]
MRQIDRLPQPECLDSVDKSKEWDDFIGTECHSKITKHLHDEQFGVCCYCEQIITLHTGDNPANCHIDHMKPRSALKNQVKEHYNYQNLALSCNGVSEIETSHCGDIKDNRKYSQKKWDEALFLFPHDSNTCGLFEYLLDGTIQARNGVNKNKAEYMITYLNLNAPILVSKRRTFARTLSDLIRLNKTPEIILWLTDNYLMPDQNNKLKKPFNSLAKTLIDP